MLELVGLSVDGPYNFNLQPQLLAQLTLGGIDGRLTRLNLPTWCEPEDEFAVVPHYDAANQQNSVCRIEEHYAR